MLHQITQFRFMITKNKSLSTNSSQRKCGITNKNTKDPNSYSVNLNRPASCHMNVKMQQQK